MNAKSGVSVQVVAVVGKKSKYATMRGAFSLEDLHKFLPPRTGANALSLSPPDPTPSV